MHPHLVRISRDGSLVVSSGSRVLVLGRDLECKLTLEAFPHGESAVDIDVSPSGRYISAVSSAKTPPEIFSAESGARTVVLRNAKRVQALRFAVVASEEVALVATKAGDVRLFRLRDNSKGVVVFGHSASALSSLAVPSRDLCVSGDLGGKIRVSCVPQFWSVQAFLMGHRAAICDVLELPTTSTTMLASLDTDGTLIIWGGEETELETHHKFPAVVPEKALALSASPDGEILVILSEQSSTLVAFNIFEPETRHSVTVSGVPLNVVFLDRERFFVLLEGGTTYDVVSVCRDTTELQVSLSAQELPRELGSELGSHARREQASNDEPTPKKARVSEEEGSAKVEGRS